MACDLDRACSRAGSYNISPRIYVTGSLDDGVRELMQQILFARDIAAVLVVGRSNAPFRLREAADMGNAWKCCRLLKLAGSRAWVAELLDARSGYAKAKAIYAAMPLNSRVSQFQPIELPRTGSKKYFHHSAAPCC